MKRKYQLLIVGATTAFVGLTLGALAMLPERPGVTKANFDRIKKGMTRAEADAIFGKPACWSGASCHASCILIFEEWTGEDGARADFVFHNDVITDDGFWTPSTETIGDKLRRWLRINSK